MDSMVSEATRELPKRAAPLQIPSLDGIRAISVLIVVISHAGYGNVVPGGLGVTVFFFLSGYLITTLLLAEQRSNGRIDIPKFYARRFFRLFPPLIITLAVAYFLVAVGLIPGGITAQGLAAQVFYFANYYALYYQNFADIPEGTAVLWSLAVEEHFYIVYPLFLICCFRNALRWDALILTLVSFCVAILLWRIYLVYVAHAVEARTYIASDTRIDSIIFGCVFAIGLNPFSSHRGDARMSALQWSAFCSALGLLLVTLAFRNPAFRETLRYSLQGIALMPIFYFAIRFSDNRVFRILSWSPLTKLGVWSYSIYLIHHVAMSLISRNMPALGNVPMILLIGSIVLSVLYAALIDRFVDQYFQRLRKRFH